MVPLPPSKFLRTIITGDSCTNRKLNELSIIKKLALTSIAWHSQLQILWGIYGPQRSFNLFYKWRHVVTDHRQFKDIWSTSEETRIVPAE